MAKKNRRRHLPPSFSFQRPLPELAEVDALIRRKQWHEARDLLRALERRYPHRTDVLERLLTVCHELKDVREYERAAERLLKLTPDNPELVLALAGAYSASAHPALALQTFKRSLRQWPEHAQADKARQAVAELESDFEAIRAATGLGDGDDALEFAALHERSQLFVERGEAAEARGLLEALLRRKPDFVPALNNLTNAYFVEGRFTQAIDTAQRALGAEPDNFHALSNLTRVLFLAGRHEEATQAAERLKAVESDRIDVWTKKAEALSFLGEDQGVRDAFDGAKRAGLLTRSLAGPLLLHLAAVVTMRQGREREARRLWQQALEIEPGFDFARDNLADLHKPPGERHAPWPYPLQNWMPPQTLGELAAAVERPIGRQDDSTITREVRRYVRKHPEFAALIPPLLDRGDPLGRAFALRTAMLAETPELLAALHDFALSQRGPDALRQEAAQAAMQAGLLEPGTVRLWLQGEWRDVLLFGFEIHGEPVQRHTPKAEALFRQASEALRAGQPERAETLFQQALTHEPDSPAILNNLAAAYSYQGRQHEAEALLREIHQRHPDYPFARIGLARIDITRGQLDQARRLIEPLLSRKRLHFSEFAALCGVEIELAEAEGNREAARSWLDLLRGAYPDHALIPEFERRLGQTKRGRRSR
ncbi:MAG: tetratricopeptide repeat protein [Chloroflexi bacterium]|nr:tetratricopeptide repeat protein [Chloroflexota bacterium]